MNKCMTHDELFYKSIAQDMSDHDLAKSTRRFCSILNMRLRQLADRGWRVFLETEHGVSLAPPHHLARITNIKIFKEKTDRTEI